MSAEVSQRTKLYFAIAAGIATAIFSTVVLDIGKGVLAHATTDDLLKSQQAAAVELDRAKQECIRIAAQLKIDQEKADLEQQKALTEMQEAHAALVEVVVGHLTQDAADTKELKTNVEWIRSGVDRLMKQRALKPEYQ